MPKRQNQNQNLNTKFSSVSFFFFCKTKKQTQQQLSLVCRYQRIPLVKPKWKIPPVIHSFTYSRIHSTLFILPRYVLGILLDSRGAGKVYNELRQRYFQYYFLYETWDWKADVPKEALYCYSMLTHILLEVVLDMGVYGGYPQIFF